MSQEKYTTELFDLFLVLRISIKVSLHLNVDKYKKKGTDLHDFYHNF